MPSLGPVPFGRAYRWDPYHPESARGYPRLHRHSSGVHPNQDAAPGPHGRAGAKPQPEASVGDRDSTAASFRARFSVGNRQGGMSPRRFTGRERIARGSNCWRRGVSHTFMSARAGIEDCHGIWVAGARPEGFGGVLLVRDRVVLLQ